ncbi:MAG TPA: zf-HC2 domain-containing protein, partial [Holophagaceae bacterium]
MDERSLDPEALTQAILARTSGAPCRRARALACDFVDGGLDGAQADLLRGHLAHCTACSALVRILAESGKLLPALAEADPGPWFTQRVLRSTSRRPAARGTDARTAWRRLLHRPRIALEAAYLGAVAGMMGLYAPVPWHRLVPPAQVWTAPLQGPAQRLTRVVVRTERHTAAALRRTFLPLRETAPAGLWRRAVAKVRGWLKRLEAALKPANP